jgi:hypothetical protein
MRERMRSALDKFVPADSGMLIGRDWGSLFRRQLRACLRIIMVADVEDRHLVSVPARC